MKKIPQNRPAIAHWVKSIATALNSLFFTDTKRDFNRLKNFIAS